MAELVVAICVLGFLALLGMAIGAQAVAWILLLIIAGGSIAAAANSR